MVTLAGVGSCGVPATPLVFIAVAGFEPGPRVPTAAPGVMGLGGGNAPVAGVLGEGSAQENGHKDGVFGHLARTQRPLDAAAVCCMAALVAVGWDACMLACVSVRLRKEQAEDDALARRDRSGRRDGGQGS